MYCRIDKKNVMSKYLRRIIGIISSKYFSRIIGKIRIKYVSKKDNWKIPNK